MHIENIEQAVGDLKLNADQVSNVQKILNLQIDAGRVHSTYIDYFPHMGAVSAHVYLKRRFGVMRTFQDYLKRRNFEPLDTWECRGMYYMHTYKVLCVFHMPHQERKFK